MDCRKRLSLAFAGVDRSQSASSPTANLLREKSCGPALPRQVRKIASLHQVNHAANTAFVRRKIENLAGMCFDPATGFHQYVSPQEEIGSATGLR